MFVLANSQRALLAFIIFNINIYAHSQVVVCVPIADLVSRPLTLDCASSEQARAKYQAIPASFQNSSAECPRVHQVLFNECLDVLDQNYFELLVSLKNSFYGAGSSQTGLWILKELVRPLTLEITQSIPAPIDYARNHLVENGGVVTLKMPFYDFITSKLYSVGTRLVCLGVDGQHAKAVVYDFVAKQRHTTYIPLCFCTINYPDLTLETKLGDFVDILQAWSKIVAKEQKYAVPFVWGGTSFKAKQSLINCKNITNRPRSKKDLCHSGFDASGLILRAAQIAGLPYFYKNCSTAIANLKPLPAGVLPVAGDLIGAKNFLVVITDVEQNKFVRAAGLSTGYGYVVENNLNELFAGINTYDELLSQIQTGANTQLVDVNGASRPPLEGLKIYTLRNF